MHSSAIVFTIFIVEAILNLPEMLSIFRDYALR